jgi:hypothetical protein
MFKRLFANKHAADEVDVELERSMQAIHERMERMMANEFSKQQRYSTLNDMPRCII